LEAERAGAGALFPRPAALRLILEVRLRAGRLPPDRRSIVVRGLEALAAERPDRPAPPLDPPARLAVARRCAVMSVLSGRPSFRRGPSDETAVGLDDLLGGEAPVAGRRSVPVAEADLEEVLGAGLFVRRDDGEWAFAHATYADVLAAEALERRVPSPERLLELLCSPEDPDRHVVPRLRGLACWLVERRSDLVEHLLGRQAELLFKADGAALSEKVRRRVVEELLGQVDAGELDPLSALWGADLSRFRFAGMGASLRAYLTDPARSRHARGLAARIAGRCQCDGLGDVLVDLARRDGDVGVRCAAIDGLAALGSDADAGALQDILDAEIESGSRDVIGALLDTLSPARIGTDDLVAYLRRRPMGAHTSRYEGFVSGLSRHARVEDLSSLLDWCADQVERSDWPRGLVSAGARLVRRGWEQATEPSVARGLARVALRWGNGGALDLGRDETPGSTPHSERRRAVLAQAVARVADKAPDDPGQIRRVGAWFRQGEDEEQWAADQSTAASLAERPVWELVVAASQPPPETPESRARSARREEDRARIDREREERRQALRELLAIPDPVEVWGRLATASRTEHPEQDEAFADPADQQRLAEAALGYLRGMDPAPYVHLQARSPANDAIWGVLATQAIQRISEERLKELSNDAWCRWTPALLAWEPPRPSLAQSMMERAEGAVTDTLLAMWAADAWSRSEVLRRMESVWTPGLGGPVLDAVSGGRLAPDDAARAWRLLIAHGVQGAAERAWRAVDDWDAEAGPVAGAALLIAGPDDVRRRVWTKMGRAPRRGRAIALAAAKQSGIDGPDLSDIGAAEAARGYRHLARLFPPGKRPDGLDALSPRQTVYEWGGRLLTRLKEAGTFEACREIRGLVQRFPNHPTLPWLLEEAVANARDRSWRPLTPSQVRELLADPELRPVRSERELLAAVRRSLERLQDEVRTESAVLNRYWESIEARKHRTEPEMAEQIEHHLRKNLRAVVVDREVELRRLKRKGRGQAIDVLVQTLPEGGEDPISCVMDLKGQWHRDLDTALRDQLVGAYLQRSRYRAGLYVVCWTGRGERDLEVTEQLLRKQAEAATDGTTLVDSMILDLSPPTSGRRQKSRGP